MATEPITKNHSELTWELLQRVKHGEDATRAEVSTRLVELGVISNGTSPDNGYTYVEPSPWVHKAVRRGWIRWQ